MYKGANAYNQKSYSPTGINDLYHTTSLLHDKNVNAHVFKKNLRAQINKTKYK